MAEKNVLERSGACKAAVVCCNVLETATTAATLPAGAVSGDRGHVFDAADLQWKRKATAGKSENRGFADGTGEVLGYQQKGVGLIRCRVQTQTVNERRPPSAFCSCVFSLIFDMFGGF